MNDYKQKIENIDKEIENFNCVQLRELLQIKEQQLRNVLNDIQIFDKFIKDLSQEKNIKSKAYEKALKAIELAENRLARTLENLDRCFRQGGSSGGECIQEERFFLEANEELGKLKSSGKIILNELQKILDELDSYIELRSGSYLDRRSLRTDISRVRIRMEVLNC